jgi:hypothetical protein
MDEDEELVHESEYWTCVRHCSQLRHLDRGISPHDESRRTISPNHFLRGFFEEGFATQHWVPTLIGTTLTKGIDYGIEPPWWIMILTILKLPYLIVAGVLL